MSDERVSDNPVTDEFLTHVAGWSTDARYISMARELIDRRAADATIERLRNQVRVAKILIDYAIGLMTHEQVGEWAGVRSFLEQDESHYQPMIQTSDDLTDQIHADVIKARAEGL